MVPNVLSLLIGKEIDRNEVGEGIAGAFEAYLIERDAGADAPLVVTSATGWSFQFLACRTSTATTGESRRGPLTS